ncbi:MAG: nucleoside hydrolase [Clostridia bacterium]|nr:nucleoside hydrolase [Clostridia bacterium]
MNKKLKVIIDTDIGDDIDDAFALLFAMELDFDIIGITTVFQNTIQRARIAKKLLKLYGKGYERVPVFAGYGTPLAQAEAQYPDLCQYTPDIELSEYAPDSADNDDAINFIINSCRKYKDELTVIAIGPFTNIAKVIERDSEALNLVKELVIMGGAFYKQYSDWNVICDVESAKIMFDNVNNIKCLGADVTHKLRINEENDKSIVNSNGSDAQKYVSEIYKKWKDWSSSIGVLHDPLAIFYVKDHGICECEISPVAVITDGFARGLTLNVSAYSKAAYNNAYSTFDFAKNHTLAKEVDRERMISEFMKCFK